MRTHNCNQLRPKNVGEDVSLVGWVKKRRDHGGIIFIDLGDRYGITQVIIDPKQIKNAELLKREFVILVKGKVKNRPRETVNNKLDTGEIEVECKELNILNHSKIPPIEIDNRITAREELRLKYRYLDLRRQVMQENLIKRHKVVKSVRDFLIDNDFIEIETPMLIKHTPEGARDYIVPSRINKGKFYSLPQSPQLYKQLLMVAGFDKYFQIARVLRDEDLRADRQPEHTQIDLEASFIKEEYIYDLIERMIKKVFKDVLNVDLKIPFKKLEYQEAVKDYGTDKPDLRFELKLKDVTEIFKKSEIKVFSSQIENNGIIKCLNAEGCAAYSRKDIEELENLVKIYKARGLAWIKVKDKLEGPVVKFMSDKEKETLLKVTNAKKGDLILFVADKKKIVNESLSSLRNHLGKRLGLIKEGFEFCWVVDFPLFKWDQDNNKWDSSHHMFTMPKNPKDIENFDKLNKQQIENIKARLFDLVLNGYELSSGSIRIHVKKLQERIMEILGLNKKTREEKFGFLLNALDYGAPPHGGIAMGLDRLVALTLNYKDIREVIAFPKNKDAESLVDNAPSIVDAETLKELGISIIKSKKLNQKRDREEQLKNK